MPRLRQSKTRCQDQVYSRSQLIADRWHGLGGVLDRPRAILFRAILPAAGTGLWVTDCGEISISFVGGYGISQRWYLFYANYPRHPN